MADVKNAENAPRKVRDHIHDLHGRLERVERALSRLEERVASLSSNDVAGTRSDELARKAASALDKDVQSQVAELEARLRQLEDENLRLDDACSKLRDDNRAISNLYVAKHRLHASFEAVEVLAIVTEILVELVGAEVFGIYLLDRRTRRLKRVVERGPRELLGEKTLELGASLVGHVAKVGKPFYSDPSEQASGSKNIPIAALPLSAKGSTMGVIVLYRLLSHKEGLTPIDHQLLELVGEHAPTALLSAHLHRKTRT